MYDAGPSRGAYGLGAEPGAYATGELACSPGPRHGAAEGCYGETGLALVLSGAVDYRSSAGAALAVPGAIIFANGGEHFSCTHVEQQESRRFAVFFGAELMQDIANASGVEAPRFARAALPPSRQAARLAALLRRAAQGGLDAALELAEAALRVSGGAGAPVSAADVARANAAARYIRSAFHEPCTLDALAAYVGVSRFHFARTFKAVVGATPSQYVLHTRLAAATQLLERSAEPITTIAHAVGFSDLSHFNASFKAAFACTPSAWRMRAVA